MLRFMVIFVLMKIFPTCVGIFGLPKLFWIHSCICAATCVIAMMILPETQGKTLTELSEMYTTPKKPGFYIVLHKTPCIPIVLL